MTALDRKLIRDLLRLRGQVVAMLSAYDSFKLTQQSYDEQYRFADVFVQLQRAPEHLRDRNQAIPGMQQVQMQMLRDVIIDVPGLPEPATGGLTSR
ncbi:hypothetical protein [Halomicronema sp. CCY15110]|uniref:hypothetical protein n=1 Tax=Halomicronema sp. CCY15110 TaxID=2767773 RepID=UPI0019513C69|nr:hypothetical protein [Halomicronema sp. CCY15110]